MQSCGHLLHVDCHQSYLKSLQVFSGLLCVGLTRNSADILIGYTPDEEYLLGP